MCGPAAHLKIFAPYPALPSSHAFWGQWAYPPNKAVLRDRVLLADLLKFSRFSMRVKLCSLHWVTIVLEDFVG